MKHLELKKLNIESHSFLEKEVTVCGWVRTSRESKNVVFVEINDGSMLNHTQVVIDKTVCQLDNIADIMALGASIKVVGTVVTSFKGNDTIEINAKNIIVLGKCDSSYPLQKKRHTLEFLRNIPHLRVRTNIFNAMFRLRSCLSTGIHKFFQDRNFNYVHTPIITGSDCEGAGEIFSVTTIGYNPKYKTEADYYADDFFCKKAGLTVSGQLEGEVMAMALGKIYTFGPTFRAENSNTPRHAAEFWQIEPEVAFAELEDIIEIATDMIKFIIDYCLTNCPQEIEFFEKHFEPGLKSKLLNVVENEFVKLEYTKAIEILIESKKEFQYPVEWGCDLQTEHERYLTDEVFNKPVFVVNYPKKLKSFYMKQNADGVTVAATDLLVPGVGEIIGCSEREADLEKLMQAIEDRNMKVTDYEQYLDLRRFGTAPHSGFGLGLERMMMYITGIGNIRDTAIYPRTKSNLK